MVLEAVADFSAKIKPKGGEKVKKAGFDGGTIFCETGDIEDMVNFFSALRPLADSEREQYLLDRLFRKYVHFCDIAETEELLSRLIGQCSDDFIRKYSLYLNCFSACCRSARHVFVDWEEYLEIKIICADMPHRQDDTEREKREYDQLSATDVPFWLR